jgi:phage protein D
MNVANAVLAASEEDAYGLHADGEVLKDTYSAVLQPYQNVQVLGVNGQLSGSWLIRQVTHTLTRNSYGQTFSLARNAQSAGNGSSNTAAPIPVF